jgi:hypothetical protein
MPTFMELQKRLKRQNGSPVRSGSEELLIADARGRMRPGEFVAEKLHAALTLDASSSSHVQVRPLPK